MLLVAFARQSTVEITKFKITLHLLKYLTELPLWSRGGVDYSHRDGHGFNYHV